MSTEATTAAASSQGAKAATKGQSVVFTGHNAYLMSVARVCREANKFTDVTLMCPDGEVVGHRLILAAASSTLRAAFLQVAGDEATDYTIIVPDVKKAIVASLVDFLYTGKLIISRSNSRDMQLLVRMLGIDPDNVRVEALEESTKKRMVQSQLTASMGLMTHKNEQKEQKSQPVPPVTKSTTEPQVNGECHPSTGKAVEGTPSGESSSKTLPSRAARRRASQENGMSPSQPKEPKLSSSSLKTPPPVPLAPIGSGFGGSNGRRKPNRPPQPPKKQQGKKVAAAAAPPSTEEEAPGLLSGYHDMSNVETWVCAICHLYDPATDEPGGGDDGSGDTTEWIGCDCNRWYHKLCTGLAVVGETFCCAQVKLSCLPPSPAKK